MTTHQLSDMPALLLARDLMKQGASGLLKIQEGRHTYDLCLRHGRIIFASSNLKRFQIRSWFEAAGKICAAELEVIDVQAPGTLGFIDALGAAGIATRAENVDTAVACLRAIVQEALTRTSDTIAFRPGRPVVTHEVTLETPTRTLLLEAAKDAPLAVRREIENSLESGSLASTSSSGPAGRDAPGAAGNDLPDDPKLRELLAQANDARGGTLYELLDVAPDASVAQIETAYHALARRFHPDILHGAAVGAPRDSIQDFFMAATEAYNRLRQPAERQAYDEELRARTQNRHDSAADATGVARENFTQGKRALVAGKLHDASQFLSNAVRLDPEQAEYHRELGIVKMANPRWQKAAEACLQKAVEMEPTDARALSHLGLLYLKNGLKRRAEDLFRRALQWDPDNEIARSGLDSPDAPTADTGLLKGLFGRR